MNTMEITKIVAGVCGSLLLLLFIKWGADAYYEGGEAYGEGEMTVYPVAEGGAAPAEEEVVEAVPFAELYAAADAGAGARVFNKCKGCHKTEEGVHAVGPSLFGVVGRPQGVAEGFEKYSGVLAEIGGTWEPEVLDQFLTSPSTYAPGTAMSFNGIPKDTDRANLIAYLATLH